MKTVLALATLLALCTASPLPQRLEADAEVIPASDLPRRTPSRADRQFPTVIVRTVPVRDLLGLDGLFGPPSRRSPLDVLFDRPLRRPIRPLFPAFDEPADKPAVAGPDFVSVPAEGPSEAEAAPAASDSDSEALPADLDRYLNQFKQLQDSLLSSVLGSSLFGRRPEGAGAGAGPGLLTPDLFGPAFPSLDDLPADYENTTTREEEINGQRVRIDETITKKKTPFGHSVFHLKVFKVNPDGTVTEQETDIEAPTDAPKPASQPEEVPSEPLGTEGPIVVEEKVEGEADAPTTLIEPQEEPALVLQEDFGPIQDPGRGVEEQMPDSLNEIP